MKNRLPRWLKQGIPSDATLTLMRRLGGSRINTVCRVAACPNFGSCLGNQQLTFMILGDTCTRNCRFCAARKADSGIAALDSDEPQRIAKEVRRLGLGYAVITSVTRDDLEDGGAGIFAKTLESIYALNPEIRIEVLIPDFSGNPLSLKRVLDAGPGVVAHNIETVPRLYPDVRPDSDYGISLGLLAKIKEPLPFLITKSSIVLGMGETEGELKEVMQDLRIAGVDVLTLGQYLAPSKEHYPVREFIAPEKFLEYKELALDLGFGAVSSGPLVRSSYRAEELYNSLVTGNYQPSAPNHQLIAES